LVQERRRYQLQGGCCWRLSATSLNVMQTAVHALGQPRANITTDLAALDRQTVIPSHTHARSHVPAGSPCSCCQSVTSQYHIITKFCVRASNMQLVLLPSSLARSHTPPSTDSFHFNITTTNIRVYGVRVPAEFLKQEAFEKCWAHSPLRAAARPFTRCRYRYCRTPPAHRCPRQQRQQQRQRVTEGTAMAP